MRFSQSYERFELSYVRFLQSYMQFTSSLANSYLAFQYLVASNFMYSIILRCFAWFGASCARPGVCYARFGTSCVRFSQSYERFELSYVRFLQSYEQFPSSLANGYLAFQYLVASNFMYSFILRCFALFSELCSTWWYCARFGASCRRFSQSYERFELSYERFLQSYEQFTSSLVNDYLAFQY
ncbi:hypothetical protein Bcell_3958 [Evansella cellulosilytica DSM 2522]|uniref:Uncharacterized protein n=1 Tax=Evansella cellulosilytica (strain ATCC 21833 / DSM 2522 / FERM P-1141 / JCM 9156 / N-4) TaxID=649639 RepID=E6TVR4_EVAC2|nr:hypothetical protein Bcell_3958 [Evansella cellulosilytica DSM 2522]